MRISLLKALRIFRRDEAGQSLIVVVSSMSVLLGMAAFAIDASTWMLHHHQDQVVADSAALAAANCLANPGKSAGSITINGTLTPVPTCSSSTDTTDATTVAEDYAAANGVTITASQVSIDTSSGKVTVTPSSTAPGVFARLFGVSTSTQSTSAKASWTASSGSCSNPGTNCDFMFANDSNCTNTTNGINIQDGGNATVQGAIQSNANLSGSTNGVINLGYGSYGPNTNGTCSNSMTYSGHNPWSSPPTQATTDASWPIDYSKDFPACVAGGTGAKACDSNGYPAYCTHISANLTFTSAANGGLPVSGNVYCAVGSGTGVVKSDPSTWNGTITITDNGNGTHYWDDTFVGGSITYSPNGKDVMDSCGYTVGGYSASTCTYETVAPSTTNYPIFYATGTGTAVNISTSGSDGLDGDVFAPNGTLSLTLSGTKTLVTFFEGNDITANINGTMKGDGPLNSGGGTNSTLGVDQLIQ